MKSICFILFFVVSSPLAAMEGASYLKINEGAKSAGMAGAYGTVPGSAESLWYNPAGLAELTRGEVAFTHLSWIEGINREYLVGALPLPLGVGGLSVNTEYSSDTYRDSLGNEAGQFSQSSMVITGGWAVHFYDISIGGSVKGLSEAVAGQSGSGIVGDAGVIADVWQEKLLASFAIQNIGTVPNLGDLSDAVQSPVTFRAGAGLKDLLPGLMLVGEAKIIQPRQTQIFMIGTQYESNIQGFGYALRAGYDSLGASFDSLSGIALGAGMSFRGLEINYSVSPSSFVGNTQRFSLGYLFGGHGKPDEVSPPAAMAVQAHPQNVVPLPESSSDLKSEQVGEDKSSDGKPSAVTSTAESESSFEDLTKKLEKIKMLQKTGLISVEEAAKRKEKIMKESGL